MDKISVRVGILALGLAALAGCSTPPAPASFEGRPRIPVNAVVPPLASAPSAGAPTAVTPPTVVQ